MKLLFDQNISFRIIKKISEFFPEAKQVRELN
jgi:predicted nuclease of predicted toxin-antitoxin system